MNLAWKTRTFWEARPNPRLTYRIIPDVEEGVLLEKWLLATRFGERQATWDGEYCEFSNFGEAHLAAYQKEKGLIL